MLVELADHVREGRVDGLKFAWTRGDENVRADVKLVAPLKFIAMTFTLDADAPKNGG